MGRNLGHLAAFNSTPFPLAVTPRGKLLKRKSKRFLAYKWSVTSQKHLNFPCGWFVALVFEQLTWCQRKCQHVSQNFETTGLEGSRPKPEASKLSKLSSSWSTGHLGDCQQGMAENTYDTSRVQVQRGASYTGSLNMCERLTGEQAGSREKANSPQSASLSSPRAIGHGTSHHSCHHPVAAQPRQQGQTASQILWSPWYILLCAEHWPWLLSHTTKGVSSFENPTKYPRNGLSKQKVSNSTWHLASGHHSIIHEAGGKAPASGRAQGSLTADQDDDRVEIPQKIWEINPQKLEIFSTRMEFFTSMVSSHQVGCKKSPMLSIAAPSKQQQSPETLATARTNLT